jgi:hypothetical protein
MVLSGCAGRTANPVAAVQPQDMMTNCAAIQAEQASNYSQAVYLNGEAQATQNQNVVAGTVGLLLFWPALFAMDFKNAAGQESAAIQGRQAYLSALAAQRCSIYAGGYYRS